MDRRSFIRSSLALGAVPVLSPSASAGVASDMPGEPVLEAPSETSIGVVWAVPGLSIGFVELADNPEMRNAVLVRDAAPVAMLDDQSLSVRLTGRFFRSFRRHFLRGLFSIHAVFIVIIIVIVCHP